MAIIQCYETLQECIRKVENLYTIIKSHKMPLKNENNFYES